MHREEEVGGEYVEVRIPAALAARIDRVFTECRGYDPSSMQESLSVLCDVASGRLELEESFDDPSRANSEVDLTPAWREHIDRALPARWCAQPTVERRVAVLVEHFVENPENFVDENAREWAAFEAVAEEEGLPPTELKRTLVDSLYGNTGLPDDLATEFLSEALQRIAQKTSGDDADTRPGERTSRFADETETEHDDPLDSEEDEDVPLLRGTDTLPGDDRVDVDSLLTDGVSQPRSDCERCGETYPVNNLEPVIGSKSSTIELLCSNCATEAE